MSSFPNSPRLLKGGIVLVDPDSGAVQRIISLQYNPDTLTRSLQIQGVTADGGGDRSEILRLKGPPIRDDQTRRRDRRDRSAQVSGSKSERGARWESSRSSRPSRRSSIQRVSNCSPTTALEKAGTLEIIPMQSALTLFIWSKNRIIPVRLTDFSITEEAFDPNLNPIRAKVSLGMRVLSVNDVDFDAKAGSLYMIYQQQKERLAGLAPAGSFANLGIKGIS